jgi:hypothetical protein
MTKMTSTWAPGLVSPDGPATNTSPLGSADAEHAIVSGATMSHLRIGFGMEEDLRSARAPCRCGIP